MNFKSQFCAMLLCSTLSSSVFAADFYARVGVAGAKNMKPEVLTNGAAVMVPNGYVGVGMSVIENLRLGVEFNGWLNNTTVANKLEVGDLLLKSNPLTLSLSAFYDFKYSSMVTTFIGAKIGYAQGVLGVNDAKVNGGDVTKNSLKELLQMCKAFGGGVLGVQVPLTENISGEVSYNLDYYSFSSGDAMKRNIFAKMSVSAGEDARPSIYVHKLAVGVNFKF